MNFVATLCDSQKGEVLLQVLLPACALCLLHSCVWSGTCAACWHGLPGCWEGGQHLVPSAVSETGYLASSGVYPKELPQIFFPLVALF